MTADAEQVLARVQRLRPRAPGELVAFDADGVLWPGDVGEDFIEWLLAQGVLDAGAAWRDYRARFPANDPQGCLALARFYTGLTVTQLADLVARYWRDAAPSLDPLTTGALRALHQAGFVVCVVSGTVRALLLPVLERLPVAHLLALELARDDGGRYSGDHTGIPTFAEGKATALRALAGARPVRLAVGNSGLDIAMLRLATDLAWAYHPDPALLAEARQRGWAITGVAHA
jgi:phosphoserine phosphatase